MNLSSGDGKELDVVEAVLDLGTPATFDPVYMDSDMHTIALVCHAQCVKRIRVIRVCGRQLADMVVAVFEPHGYTPSTEVRILEPSSAAVASVLAVACYLLLVAATFCGAYVLRGLVVGFAAPFNTSIDFLALCLGITVVAGTTGLTQFVDAMAGSYYCFEVSFEGPGTQPDQVRATSKGHQVAMESIASLHSKFSFRITLASQGGDEGLFAVYSGHGVPSKAPRRRAHQQPRGRRQVWDREMHEWGACHNIPARFSSVETSNVPSL